MNFFILENSWKIKLLPKKIIVRTFFFLNFGNHLFRISPSDQINGWWSGSTDICQGHFQHFATTARIKQNFLPRATNLSLCNYVVTKFQRSYLDHDDQSHQRLPTVTSCWQLLFSSAAADHCGSSVWSAIWSRKLRTHGGTAEENPISCAVESSQWFLSLFPTVLSIWRRYDAMRANSKYPSVVSTFSFHQKYRRNDITALFLHEKQGYLWSTNIIQNSRNQSRFAKNSK